MQVRVISPERIILETSAEQVIVDTVQGKMGILENHCPLVAVLQPGEIRFQYQGKWQNISSSSGLIQINNNQVMILLDQ